MPIRNVRLGGLATIACLLLLAGGSSRAASSMDIQEVAALVVYSSIQASDSANGGDEVETFVTVTNAKSDETTVRMSFVNGESSSNKYCYTCDFDVPLTGYDTETLVITPNGAWTDLRNLDADYDSSDDRFGARTCPWSEGMLVAWGEDTPGDPESDNRLFGDAVVVNYTDGYAYSIPAHPVQSLTGDPTTRSFDFGEDFASFPRVVATNFFAPTVNDAPAAELVLFTLDFARQHPPVVDCSIVGVDANENAFSSSVIFGCWEKLDLCQDVDPEFCYPNLGLNSGGGPHTHGWLSLSCEVDHDAHDNVSEWSDGGVHGALIQRAASGTVLRKGEPGAPAIAGASAWARLLIQSVSQGDTGSLTLDSAVGPGPLD